MFRLDYISCVLTIIAAILLGQKRWQGWLVAGVNSILICDIAVNTAQLGFIPANVFCVALYAYYIVGWRKQVKAHRELNRLNPNVGSHATPRHVEYQIDSAPRLPGKPRTLVTRPDAAELRSETFCCERSSFSFLDGREGSPGKHLDLRNLLTGLGNP